jgi:hypothetical protein
MAKQCVQIVCLMVIAGFAPLVNAGAADLSKTEKARVYSVFFSLPANLSGKILSALESRCYGVQCNY